MNNEVKHDKVNRKFFIDHGTSESHLIYEIRNKDTIDFVRTFVPKQLRNNGIASKIVIEGLTYARKNNLKVIPTCSFTKDLISRNHEFKDLLK